MSRKDLTQRTLNGSPYPVVVNHGSTAGTARPAGATFVQWVGSVTPTNAVDGDEWHDTSSTTDPTVVPANRQTASYTLVLADQGYAIEMNVATANNLTVPPNSSVAFPVGAILEVGQYGAGQTTIVAGAGVTIRSAGGKLKLTSQYSTATLRKVATDEWWAAGDLSL